MEEEMFSANPSKYNFLKQLNVDEDVQRRLSLLLSSTEKGNTVVLMTPIGRDNTPERVLSEWDKVFLANKSLLNNTLLDLEREQRGKFGPMSLAKPWSERKQTLLESYQPEEIGSNTINMIPNLAVGRRTLRPISINGANKLLQNTTNSGLPYFTKKGIVKERVLERFEELLERKDPCILFTRTQEQSKTRNVWGFPIADTLNEMRYYSPLLSYQKKLSYRSAVVSPEETDRKVSEIFHRIRDDGRHLVSIDFTAYDSTVKHSLQTVGFNYIKALSKAIVYQT